MMMSSFRDLLLALLFFGHWFNSYALNVSYDERAITINGERRVLIAGSIHYPRSTAQMWPGLIQKAKDGGLDAIDMYIFWNAHEPQRREYNFEGDLDFIKFIKIAQSGGLYVILRIGPYVCAEWKFGGVPVWLHQLPGVEFRTENQIFKDEMQNFTTLIINMVKEEKLLAPQGGPIIITQIENEYGNAMKGYGAAGQTYIQWCAELAESLDVGVPWIMCQQPNPPSPMINTCNGFYCDKFQPSSPNSPKMWTENWTGWFKAWGEAEPHRPVKDVAFAVARFFESGGTYQNYYMYHGGTNFGRTAGGPFLTTSYDYDAPIDEYGNVRQPKWGHLKQLHVAIKAMEKALTHGEANTTDFGNSVGATKYIINDTDAGCFLVNANQSTDATVNFEGTEYYVPARSVSILPDCKTVVFNTAKVSTQTNLMVNKPTGADGKPAPLSWEWKAETIKSNLKGKGSFETNQLLEQINTTGDTSDYLWYMTSVNITEEDASFTKTMTLRVKTAGHVLHAFYNGRLIGSQYATAGNYKFLFEKPVKLRSGKNFISLLSATVGLANYRPHFDSWPAGIARGPVQLVAADSTTIDLTRNTWSYKIGMHGERMKLYSPQHHMKWYSADLAIDRPLTWYKTAFELPEGEDALVLDLQGMGKGEAWVNGQSIGRYWPSFMAAKNECQPCDYRIKYDDSKCRTGCDQPSQRWYHVPRSYTTAGANNTLVLFEEVGGDPSNVSLQTVVVGAVCGNVGEGSTLSLSCPGQGKFTEIQFASFGDQSGECGSFQKGSCEAPDTLAVIQKECIGHSNCTIDATEKALGKSGCSNNVTTTTLAVQAVR